MTAPKEFARQSPLPADLERKLVVAAEAGDSAAREQLVRAFLPHIGGVARRYQGLPMVDRDELVQEGVVGLLRAVKRYEPALGTPFWAYASWWVRQAMQQLVSELTRPVVLSDRATRQLARIKEARREHQQANGSDPSPAELATTTGLTREQVEALTAIEHPPRGLEEPLMDGDDAAGRFGDLLADPVAEDEYDRVVELEQIEGLPDLTEVLDERERRVLQAHYGLGSQPQTLKEIAADLGLSVERVRQIEEQALKKMREAAAHPHLT